MSVLCELNQIKSDMLVIITFKEESGTKWDIIWIVRLDNQPKSGRTGL